MSRKKLRRIAGITTDAFSRKLCFCLEVPGSLPSWTIASFSQNYECVDKTRYLLQVVAFLASWWIKKTKHDAFPLDTLKAAGVKKFCKMAYELNKGTKLGFHRSYIWILREKQHQKQTKKFHVKRLLNLLYST